MMTVTEPPASRTFQQTIAEGSILMTVRESPTVSKESSRGARSSSNESPCKITVTNRHLHIPKLRAGTYSKSVCHVYVFEKMCIGMKGPILLLLL